MTLSLIAEELSDIMIELFKIGLPPWTPVDPTDAHLIKKLQRVRVEEALKPILPLPEKSFTITESVIVH
jgi:hypothetical protein